MSVLTYEERLNADRRWALMEGSMHFEKESAVQQALRKIARELDRIERGDLVPAERARAVEAIAEEVETLWLSDTIRGSRPTVLDEVRHCLNVVEGSLLDVVPRVYRTVEASLRDAYPDREWRVPPFLQFGSWIGGDSDGHPGVSPLATAEAILTGHARVTPSGAEKEAQS